MVKIQHFRAGDEPSPENINKIQERLERYEEPKELSEMPASQDQDIVKEKVREALKSMGREAAEPAPAFSPDEENSSEKSESISFLPAYMKNKDGDWGDEKELKAVSDLVAEALNGDILETLKKANNLPPHILDAFHDALIDVVVPILKKKGTFK